MATCSQEIQSLKELGEARMPLCCLFVCFVFKDLQEVVFHKLIKEAKLTTQTKAAWAM